MFKNNFIQLNCLLVLFLLSCGKKSVEVPAAEETISGISLNEWKFTAEGKQYSGVINVAYKTQGSGLSLEARTKNSNDTTLLFLVGFSGDEIQKGYYNTAGMPYNSLFYMKDNNSVGIFDANPNTANYGIITYQVISFEAATRQVKIKFSGKTRYNYNNTLDIADGAIWAVVQ